jgi:penicillin-binding protein 1A
VANYEGHGFGRATLRTATALSINTVYAGLLLRLGGGDADRGARAVVEAARRMGVASPLPAVPSAVLGTGGVTPLEMASAYATLAAKGPRAAPFGVRQITGPDGRVLYQARPDSEQVVPPAVAAIAADVLREVVDHGTGARGRIGRPAAAKTGTTQDHADAWFVGFTPSLAVAVGVGYPQGQVPMAPPRTTSRVSGGTWPAAIWGGFMRAALAGEPPGRFPRPDTSLVKVALDVERGCLPNRFTPAAQVASIVYLRASAPTRTCRDPDGPVQGLVPALVGVPVGRAAAWLSGAGLSLRQRLRVDDAAAPGTVPARRRPAGRPAAGGAGGPDRGRGRVGGRRTRGDAGSRGARPARGHRPPAAGPGRPGRRGAGRLRRRPARAATEPGRQVAAVFFCRTVSSTLCACWSTKRVNSCWA